MFFFIQANRSINNLLILNNSNELINKIVIKGNTREFVEEHGIENCYSNGKEIHLQFCRSRIYEMLKRFNKEIVNILDENILLLDDDVQNLKLETWIREQSPYCLAGLTFSKIRIDQKEIKWF